jgi:predicted site-specific integrase-resolvase
MTRRQVAAVFRVTSAAVATWARRGRLPEVRDEVGRPRYRRADVEELFRGGARARRSPRSHAEDVAGRRSPP